MKNKRFVIATVLAVIMSPIMLAGFLFRPVQVYFAAGMEMMDVVVESLEKWLSKKGGK